MTGEGGQRPRPPGRHHPLLYHSHPTSYRSPPKAASMYSCVAPPLQRPSPIPVFRRSTTCCLPSLRNKLGFPRVPLAPVLRRLVPGSPIVNLDHCCGGRVGKQEEEEKSSKPSNLLTLFGFSNRQSHSRFRCSSGQNKILPPPPAEHSTLGRAATMPLGHTYTRTYNRNPEVEGVVHEPGPQKFP